MMTARRIGGRLGIIWYEPLPLSRHAEAVGVERHNRPKYVFCFASSALPPWMAPRRDGM